MSNQSNKMITVNAGIYFNEKIYRTSSQPSPRTTTLGLIGETIKGPAFHPFYITNDFKAQPSEVFNRLFGGTSNEKYIGNGMLRYELPYIANNFLTESNQLFVTRVLGLTGYNAGKAWAIKLQTNNDTSTNIRTTTGVTTSNIISFTADSANTITTFASTDSYVQSLWDNGSIPYEYMRNLIINAYNEDYTTELSIPPIFDNTSVLTYSGFEMTNLYVTSSEVFTIGSEYNGLTATTSATTYYVSGDTYPNVDDKVVAVLRSRANYNNESLEFALTGGTTSIAFDTSFSGATLNPLNPFVLSGISSGAIANTTGFSYTLSLDENNPNFIKTSLGTTPTDGNKMIYVSEFYGNMLKDYINNNNKAKGIKLSLVEYDDNFKNYKQQYTKPSTPWIVSQIFGSNIFRLFRCFTIGDGEYSNTETKITITNINFTNKTFDLIIRDFNDTDSNKIILEQYIGCTMNPEEPRFIAKLIGTLNGDYPQFSNYITLEIDFDSDLTNTLPAGFIGYPIKDYEDTFSNTAIAPSIPYKTYFKTTDNKQTTSLGFNSSIGYDADILKYIGKQNNTPELNWTGLTKGFHLDIQANQATIDNVKYYLGNNIYYQPIFEFETGDYSFKDDDNFFDTDYQETSYRTFTTLFYGGHDGWDINRKNRTFNDTYFKTNPMGVEGFNNNNFSLLTTTDNVEGINSDLYAYWNAILTFKNPEETPIDLIATTGIDMFNNTKLIDHTIDLIESYREDCLYIATLPDTTGLNNSRLEVDDVVSEIEGLYDSNYATTFWPWIKTNDDTWLPPTYEVARLFAANDNNFQPWFATAGINRGFLNIKDVRRKESNVATPITKEDRDLLYTNRINPIYTINTGYQIGNYIWGNKTLQDFDSKRNRITVRRLLNYIKKEIKNIAKGLLFDPNDNITKGKLIVKITPILNAVKNQRGIDDFKIIIDPIEQNLDGYTISGTINIRPVDTLEFIEFVFDINI